MPPPMSRKSTRRSGNRLAPALQPEERFQLILLAGVEDGEDLVAALQDRVRGGDEAAAAAQDRDQQAPFRHFEVADAPPGDLRVAAQLHLDDLDLLLLQVEQVDEAVLGHLVL